MLLSPERFERFEQALQSRFQPPVDVVVADRSLLEQVIGHNLHQGIMALAEVPFEPDFRSLPSAQPSVG